MKLGLLFLSMAIVYPAFAVTAPVFHQLDQMPSELEAVWGMHLEGTREIQERIELPSPQFVALAAEQMRVVLPDSKAIYVEHMPELPMIQRSFPLPQGQTAVVHFDNMVLEESSSAVKLKALPEALVWSGDHDFAFGNTVNTRYFPGRIFDQSERDGVLYVNIFPVQYDRTTGKLVVLKSADLWIDLFDKTVEMMLSPNGAWGSEGLILTSKALESAARTLQKYHEVKYGLKSEVVTVESIGERETAVSEDELPDGYKQKGAADTLVHAYDADKKKGYNYQLARKIINFLHKRMGDGSPTKYVTLLGDATHVPPSYYFSIRAGFSAKFGVTDQCYAARNKCSDPKLAVGRLPFNTEAELVSYLKKVNRWIGQVDDAKSELALFGGKAFPADVFIGELGTLKTINSDKADWRGVKKYFRTRKTYNKDAVLDLVNGNTTSSFVYYLDHGMGNRWAVEKEAVSSKEILAAKDFGPEVNPMIVSIACSNAAYDETLTKDDVLSGAQFGAQSVGVSLLKSKAGAVGYLGNSRPALGQPVYEVDRSGNLTITGTTHGLQYFDGFFDKYQAARGGRLGDIFLKASHAYVHENGNDMKDIKNQWTYFNVVLLGDPAIPLPARKKTEKAFAMPRSSADFELNTSSLFPRFILKGQALNLAFEAATQVKATLLRTALPKGEEVLTEKEFSGSGALPVSFKKDDEAGQYFLRLENLKGVPLERQVWFETAQGR